MYSEYSQILILIVVLMVIIGVFIVYNTLSVNSKDQATRLESDFVTVKEIMINNSHLHRFLMIEIIGDRSGVPENRSNSDTIDRTDESSDSKSLPEYSKSRGQADISPSEAVTFSKISSEVSLLGKLLSKSFGTSISQRIITLMHKRDEILREYYHFMRTSVCDGNMCRNFANLSYDTDKSLHVSPDRSRFSSVFEKHASNFAQNVKSVTDSSLDIVTVTHRKLEAVTREITDNISISFYIKDVEQISRDKRPLIHHQRFFNLLTMYDKELVNQARSYAAKHYDISMNCSKSLSDLACHISDELINLMIEIKHKSPAVL